MNVKNKKVALIGASSQIGASVAFYLKKYTTYEPVCFIRSGYSKVFFEMLGIKTIATGIGIEEMKPHLKDVNWVLDFTYPTGQVAEIPVKIQSNLNAILGAMPKGSNFIYMSSIMAFGMPDGEKNVHHYKFPRTTYSHIKRSAEHHIQRLGKKYQINVFTFRLSQVHGFLQSVNTSYRQKLSSSTDVYIDGNPDDLTNTIFISSLSEAFVKCFNGDVKPGLYTLISQPQWTLEELYKYYADYYSFHNNIIFSPADTNGSKGSVFRKVVFAKLTKYRPIIEAYLLMKFPKLAIKIKGKYRELQTGSNLSKQGVSYIDFHLLGKPDSKIISDIHSDLSEVFAKEKEMEMYFNQIVEEQSDDC